MLHTTILLFIIIPFLVRSISLLWVTSTQLQFLDTPIIFYSITSRGSVFLQDFSLHCFFRHPIFPPRNFHSEPTQSSFSISLSLFQIFLYFFDPWICRFCFLDRVGLSWLLSPCLLFGHVH